jgi:antitoxin MazE
LRTAIAKWGNSLALRLPQAIAADACLREGTAVELTVEGNILVVRAARPRYRLEELLDGYQPEHRHGEGDWGPPVGKETW